MKKIWIGIILLLGITAVGAYYWYWQLLHNKTIIAQPEVELSAESGQSGETEDKSNGWISALILGTDNREDEVSRTDSIMLVLANVDTRQVSVISIPRDIRVNLQGIGLTKINHANALGEINGGKHQGTLDSAKAVSDLLGVAINYYVKIDFQGFEKVVDAVGGVDINLPYPINDKYRGNFPAGEQHLSGKEALNLARARFGLPNGDFGRQKFQFKMLSSLAHKMLSVSNIPNLPGELQIIFQDIVDTNLSIPEILAKVVAFKGITEDTIKYYQLPGHGIYAHDPWVGQDLYYYEPDMDGVKKVVQEAIKNVTIQENMVK